MGQIESDAKKKNKHASEALTYSGMYKIIEFCSTLDLYLGTGKVLERDSANGKALCNKGRALIMLGELEKVSLV